MSANNSYGLFRNTTIESIPSTTNIGNNPSNILQLFSNIPGFEQFGNIISSNPPNPPNPPELTTPFSKLKLNTTPNQISKFIYSRISQLEELIEKHDSDEEFINASIEYYKLGFDLFQVIRISLIDNVLSIDPNNIKAISEKALYYYNCKKDDEAMTYFIKLAEAGCDNYCHIVNQIHKDNTSSKPNISNPIDKYWRTLFVKNKSNKVVTNYMLNRIMLYDISDAKHIYETVISENPDFEPIDFTKHGGAIINQVIYGDSNPFPKDIITNNYINKLKTEHFNIIDQCPVCCEERNLVALECTHFICADNCYPIKMIMKQNCPVCRC
jgi:tetratricopeptide (TPR) repeat protein